MDLTGVARHEPASATGSGREAAVVAPVVRFGVDGVDPDRDPDPDPDPDPDAEAARDPAEWGVLFTKRADHLGNHPGQMSFPGGGREPHDADLRATALREVDEEIGLEADEVRFHGRLDDLHVVSGYVVRPFVATVPDRTYVPDEREVAEVAVLSVADLTDLDNYASERRDHPTYGEVRLHFFDVDGYTVWGATGRMLVQLLELATDWRAPPEPDRVADADADLPL
jgi:8-oxo-dGTP pyrophosphatase MutT (NUDIX family)